MLINKTLIAIAIIFLIGIIWFTTMRSLAAFEFKQVDLSLLQEDEIQFELLPIQLDHINRALEYHPKNPEYLDAKGRFVEVMADEPNVTRHERMILLNQSADQFRESIKRRPLWPYSWSQLLNVKDKLNEIDGEYMSVFRRSDELGPWEPKIQLRLIQSGLTHWRDLKRSYQTRVIKIIERAMQRQPRETFELIKLFNRPELICSQVYDNSSIDEYCADKS